ncbi:MAG: zinc chelation protein SecC [Fusobacterium mortiferum]|nr:zinc chelation protein SecC [Fusobacterium mortiferum]
MSNPKTALELMKARYEAYTKGDIEFIKNTHDPKTAKGIDWKEAEEWSKNSKWLSLEIVETIAGTQFDKEGIVEFKAKYIDLISGEEVVHHERSYFVKKGRHWYYKGWLPINNS